MYVVYVWKAMDKSKYLFKIISFGFICFFKMSLCEDLASESNVDISATQFSQQTLGKY